MDKIGTKVTRKRKSEILDDAFDEIVSKKSKCQENTVSTTLWETPSTKSSKGKTPSSNPSIGKPLSTTSAKEKAQSRVSNKQGMDEKDKMSTNTIAVQLSSGKPSKRKMKEKVQSEVSNKKETDEKDKMSTNTIEGQLGAAKPKKARNPKKEKAQSKDIIKQETDEKDLKTTKSAEMLCQVEKISPSLVNNFATNKQQLDSGMWTEAEMLCKVEKISPNLANNFVSLIEEGCTIPFIARYRKTAVENLVPEKLQELYESYINFCNLKKKVLSILETLKKSNKLTPEINWSLVKARNLSEVEFVYAPFKTNSLSLAEKARKLGLEPHAKRALSGDYNIDLYSLCSSHEELNTVEKVATHMTHIVADIIYKDTRVLEKMRILKKHTKFTIQTSRTKSSTKAKAKEDEKKKNDRKADPETYKIYFEWKCLTQFVKSYQTLAINRGEDQKILTVKIIIPDSFYVELERHCLLIWGSEHWVRVGLADAYARLMKPWLTRQVRTELTNYAEKEAVKTFVSNLEKYLLTEPIKNRTIAGLDPGFKAGCKVGIINPNGEMLAVTTIYPNLSICDRANHGDLAVKQLQNLLTNHSVQLIGLGNGTACRETESWLKSNGISKNIPVVIVPEQGASIYSVSKEARKEHKDLDPNLISALSIARRVLDPLGELIKVDPKNLGVGLYQHDIPPKMLDTALEGAVEKIVSLVGVDLNTASQAMLRRISGLNDSRATKIIQYRQANTRFNSRAELMKVGGVGKVTFQQCAGFLKVLGGEEILDATIIHPESYGIARAFAKKIGVNINHLSQAHFPMQVEMNTASLNLEEMSKDLGTDVPTLELIINAFKQKPQEDNIIAFCRPVYSVTVQKTEQVREGMVLTGVVRNVVPFGCFVDCGLKDNGLIHRSQLGGQSPKLGDRVSVTVIGEAKPKKIGLKLNQILN